MVPGLPKQRAGPEVRPARLPLSVAEHVGLANLQGQVLAPGVFLQIGRQREGLDDVAADDNRPVGLQEDGLAPARVDASRSPMAFVLTESGESMTGMSPRSTPWA